MTQFWKVFHQFPPDSENARLVEVAEVPAKTAEEAMERAKKLGILHPVIKGDQRDPHQTAPDRI